MTTSAAAFTLGPLVPAITDPPPAEVVAELAGLREALDRAVPAKRLDRNVLIATWNIRALGGLTEKWRSEADDSPKRDLASVLAIAEIISRFDVVAVQELRGNLKALRELLRVLGGDWGLLLTDVTKGQQGNDERLGFVFDTRRVKPSGLAAELVIPDEQLKDSPIEPGALQRQFARTPYAASFITAGHQTFILVTLHVLYGDRASERTGELRAIAQWLAEWAGRTHRYHQNFIALGDFNIDRKDDANWQAFTDAGLAPAPELQGLSRTIFDDPGEESFFDQIAWFSQAGKRQLTLNYEHNAGRFEFNRHLGAGLDAQQLSWRISDHYPLWTEFAIPRD